MKQLFIAMFVLASLFIVKMYIDNVDTGVSIEYMYVLGDDQGEPVLTSIEGIVFYRDFFQYQTVSVARNIRIFENNIFSTQHAEKIITTYNNDINQQYQNQKYCALVGVSDRLKVGNFVIL